MSTGSAPIFLVSMPQMADPNFAQTVVLLCDYTEEGAFGLVVNRQMSEPAWQLVQTDPPVRVDPDLRLWMGGPVDPQRTRVLMSDAQGPDEEQREICPGVLLSVSHTLTLQLLQTPSSRARVFRRVRGMGAGTARPGTRRACVADLRRGSLVDFRSAVGRDVGGGAPTSRHGSGRSASQLRGALNPAIAG